MISVNRQKHNLVVDFLPILLSYGGWVVDEENQPTVNSDEFIDAMNYYVELIGTGEAQVKDDLVASIDNGAATMGVAWPGWYTPTADSAADYIAMSGKVQRIWNLVPGCSGKQPEQRTCNRTFELSDGQRRAV